MSCKTAVLSRPVYLLLVLRVETAVKKPRRYAALSIQIVNQGDFSYESPGL